MTVEQRQSWEQYRTDAVHRYIAQAQAHPQAHAAFSSAQVDWLQKYATRAERAQLNLNHPTI